MRLHQDPTALSSSLHTYRFILEVDWGALSLFARQLPAECCKFIAARLQRVRFSHFPCGKGIAALTHELEPRMLFRPSNIS